MQVHNINMEVIINNKKTPSNVIVMVRFSWCNLNFHSYKLHAQPPLLWHYKVWNTHFWHFWLPTIIEVVKSKKLELILPTFSTTLTTWNSPLTVTQPKPYTLLITRNLNPMCLSSHAQRKKEKTKSFQKEKNAKGLEVKMVFNLCATCVELVEKQKPWNCIC